MPYTDESRAKLHATMIKKIQGEYPGLSDTEAFNVWKTRQRGLGRKGGSLSSNGGFAYMSKNDPKRHSQISAKGGTISRRRKQNESK